MYLYYNTKNEFALYTNNIVMIPAKMQYGPKSQNHLPFSALTKILSEKYGMEADVINLHSLVPLKYEKIVESVRKRNRKGIHRKSDAEKDTVKEKSEIVRHKYNSFHKKIPTIAAAILGKSQRADSMYSIKLYMSLAN